jgi:hypothetical protein
MFKKGLMVCIVTFLFFPLIQEFFHLAELKNLSGAIEYYSKPSFTFKAWLDGKFQEEKEKYVNQNFGYRNFLVRLNNQLDYWFHNKANAESIIYGKNGILMGKTYTDAYYGINYIGDEKVKSEVRKMKFISDTLRKLNKNFIVIIAPGKASFFPEAIPAEYITEKKKSNYEGYRDEMQKQGVDYIDFNRWFIQMKDTSRYPLYPTLGIHWSIYGAALATDSLVGYVEKKRNQDLPEFKIIGIEQPDTLRDPDGDIYWGINLINELPFQKMTYPVYAVHSDSSKVQPSVLIVGDSYWWNVFNFGITGSVFKNGKFWFYNKSVWPESYTKKTSTSEVDFDRQIRETDVILFCHTESTMHDMGYGVVDQLYKYFTEGKKNNTKKGEAIQHMIDYIKTDKVWMESIYKRADSLRIPVDSLIKLDATWQVEHTP